MRKPILNFITIFILTFLVSLTTFAQLSTYPDCHIESSEVFSTSSSFIGGNSKPERSDLSGGLPANPTSYFPLMIVFVQYQNETVQSNHWPAGQPPTYMNTLLSNTKQTNTNWWEAYDENSQLVSSYWIQASRGKFHVLGKAFSIILDHEQSYYITNGGQDRINAEVYDKLKMNPEVNWTFYDRWSKNPENGKFYYQRDGNLDMLCMVHRTVTAGGPIGNYQGFAPLGSADYQFSYLVDSANNISINGHLGSEGSGFKVNGKFGPVALNTLINIMTHEWGHYLYGSGHTTYSVMARGPGSEFFLSPWERVKLGYMTPAVIDYNNVANEYSIDDYSGRNSSEGDILQVPISMNDSNEFFLIANRRNVSKFDRVMQGDTARDNPLRNINPEYGKGVYIYHIRNGYEYPGVDAGDLMDLECADGLFNWTVAGTMAPDWDPTNHWLPIFKKLSVSYSNDNGNTGINSKDGMNVNDPVTHQSKWFSEGKLSTTVNGDGTDRAHTNEVKYWTSRESKGDRYDAWNIGSNQIFSPYSSPSTNNWNNEETGIFVYYSSLTGNNAKIKIYKTGYGNFQTEEQILEVTPPSRPMGLKIESSNTRGVCYPKLIWNHNREPDMLRTNGTKRYRIYRSEGANMSQVPSGLGTLIATVDISSDSIPTYIDTKVKKADCYFQLRSPTGTVYPVRYRIVAVDMYNSLSVPSDFSATNGVRNGMVTYELDNGSNGQTENNLLPTEFSLRQNYPNPFNPSTSIKFELPVEGQVTIVVYNLLGKEVNTIVNEFRQAGIHNVSFDGSDLPSGVYYYKLKSGSFESVKRMVLLK